MQKKKVKNEVSSAISRLTIPYLSKYADKINGIYLAPYSVGGLQKIEVVVVKKVYSDIPVTKKNISINELKIHIVVNQSDEYRGQITDPRKFKLAQDLKYGYIIYDPKSTLTYRKEYLSKKEEVKPYINSYELPNELIKLTKSNVYSIKKK